MDADPPPRTSGSTLATLEAADGRSTAAPDDLPADGGDDPYSSISLFHSTAPLLGALIGVVTLLLPVASVLGSRSPATLLARPESAHGLAQPAGLAGTGPGEPGGGDPRRQQQ